MATRAKKVLAGIAALAALAFGGAALAQAGSGGGSSDQQGSAPAASQPATEQGESTAPESSAADPSKPINNGGALKQAKAAALDATGGGRVTGTEVRDEEGYYEVEVTRDDGSQVDVHLDRAFNVTDQSADGGGSDGGA